MSKKSSKIRTVLLGETHFDNVCVKDNLQKIYKIISSYQITPESEFFLVSEGRGINPCFKAMAVQSHKLIIETETKTKNEMIQYFLLTTELLQCVADGSVSPGDSNPDVPDTIAIDKTYFDKCAKIESEGFLPMLEAIPNGVEIYYDLINAAFSRDLALYHTLFEQLLSSLVTTNYFDNELAPINLQLTEYLRTKDETILKAILEQIRFIRDENIIKKIENAVINKKGKPLKLVIIIFGALHYDYLVRLITQSNILELDTANSSNIRYGGRSRKRLKFNKKITRSKILRGRKKTRSKRSKKFKRF